MVCGRILGDYPVLSDFTLPKVTFSLRRIALSCCKVREVIIALAFTDLESRFIGWYLDLAVLFQP